jgi:hypothetical protein
MRAALLIDVSLETSGVLTHPMRRARFFRNRPYEVRRIGVEPRPSRPW